MCGRYALSTPADILSAIFDIPIPSPYHPRYNIAPTQDTLIICAGTDGRAAIMARWGFIPSWRTADQKGPEPINARCESAATSRLFAQPLRRQRCVVPASGFYEWQKVSGAKHKRAYLARSPDGSVLALAGVWSSRPTRGGTSIESFAILTCAPNASMKPIHDRMPLILSADARDAWLDPGTDDAGTIAQMLIVPPPSSISIREVSTWVNSTSHDDPRCIEPIRDANTLF